MQGFQSQSHLRTEQISVELRQVPGCDDQVSMSDFIGTQSENRDIRLPIQAVTQHANRTVPREHSDKHKRIFPREDSDDGRFCKAEDERKQNIGSPANSGSAYVRCPHSNLSVAASSVEWTLTQTRAASSSFIPLSTGRDMSSSVCFFSLLL